MPLAAACLASRGVRAVGVAVSVGREDDDKGTYRVTLDVSGYCETACSYTRIPQMKD